MEKDEIEILKNAKEDEFLLLRLHYREVGYGGSKFNWESPAVVRVIFEDGRLSLCCVKAGPEDSPERVFVDKGEYFYDEENSCLSIISVKKITQEEAQQMVREKWHEIAFERKEEIAFQFGFKYKVEEKKIKVAVHLLYPELEQV